MARQKVNLTPAEVYALGGETVYASDQAIRRMLEPVYDELEPL